MMHVGCYAAPELFIQDIEYDNKVDVWSLGVIVSELLTGEVCWAPQ